MLAELTATAESAGAFGAGAAGLDSFLIAATMSPSLEIGEELADVLYWVLLMSHDLDIDVIKALEKKIQKNAEKYPVEKSKGKHTKYTEL